MPLFTPRFAKRKSNEEGGGPMDGIAYYLASFVFVVALIFAGAWLLKLYLGRGSVFSLNGGKKNARISVSEAVSIGGRHRLLLVRRDGIEHLVLVGGPVDVVIESGISHIATQQSPPQSGSARTKTAEAGFNEQIFGPDES
jgi:flagellar biogenesis protein FliO